MIRKIRRAPVALAIIYRRLSLAKDLFFCAVLGDRRVLPMEIDLRKTVGHLEKEIKKRNPDLIRCDAALLKLYLAKRSNGTWLNTNDDDDANALQRQELPSGTQDLVQEQVQEARRLNNVAYFGTAFSRQQDDIRILVQLPEEAAAEGCAAVGGGPLDGLEALLGLLLGRRPAHSLADSGEAVECVSLCEPDRLQLGKKTWTVKIDETLAWTEDETEGLANTTTRYHSIQDELGDDISVPREIGRQVVRSVPAFFYNLEM
ncbi:hypothetical protein FI667_g14347, partial [Globisporangium splendens]